MIVSILLQEFIEFWTHSVAIFSCCCFFFEKKYVELKCRIVIDSTLR